MAAPIIGATKLDHLEAAIGAVDHELGEEEIAQLEAAFREAQRDRDVHCVVLTGQDPAFCSGDDVREIMVGEMSRPTK